MMNTHLHFNPEMQGIHLNMKCNLNKQQRISFYQHVKTQFGKLLFSSANHANHTNHANLGKPRKPQQPTHTSAFPELVKSLPISVHAQSNCKHEQ
jgi:hypothetical protein